MPQQRGPESGWGHGPPQHCEQLVAFDVNTVSPPHDVAGMTAMLAARVMLECLFLICRSLGEFPRE